MEDTVPGHRSPRAVPCGRTQRVLCAAHQQDRSRIGTQGRAQVGAGAQRFALSHEHFGAKRHAHLPQAIQQTRIRPVARGEVVGLEFLNQHPFDPAAANLDLLQRTVCGAFGQVRSGVEADQYQAGYALGLLLRHLQGDDRAHRKAN